MNRYIVQNSFILFVITFFLGCSPEAKAPQSKTYPQWYGKQAGLALASYDVVGFGEGTTLAQAQANAKEMIAQQLLSRVESSFESVMGDEVSKNEAKLKVTSDLRLHSLTTLKQEQRDGSFFVALRYKNLDFAQRVKERLALAQCTDEMQNNYLARTPLFKKLNDALGCSKDFRLHRQNGAWYLRYDQHLFLLSDLEFEELFISSANSTFSLSTPSQVLNDGDSFSFTLRSQKEGYITMVDVYESGIVTLLQNSTKITNSLHIPSLESAYEFEAGVLQEGRDTYDLYVAFFTKEPLDVSRFTYAGEEFASDESAYKFHELLELMQEHEMTSLLLRTRAK